MIYEMVRDNLDSLANQWRDLAQEFDRLINPLLTTDPRLAVLDNPVLPTTHQQRGLRDRCRDEAARLRILVTASNTASPLPANTLFQDAANNFRLSDAELNVFNQGIARDSIAHLFESNFPSLPSDLVEITLCRTRIEKLADFLRHGIQEFEEVLSVEGERLHISGIRGSVDNLASYPILTESLGGAVPTAAAPAGPGGHLSLQMTIDRAMREVLGRMPKTRDPRSFVVALNQSFALNEVEGRTEFHWTPRSYAGQTDLGGGVTGAQASLATRGKVALDNILPLLEGLYPLLPDADKQETEAARAIVRSELTEIVNEFGVEGGPRVERVNTLFNLLLVQNTTGINGATVSDGKLGYLRSVFGLTQGQVNTLEEETNVTNFVVIQDYIESLQQSWNSFTTTWLGRDLGTRIVLLGRALSVASESVNEIYAAMDSVFVGAAERQVVSFNLPSGGRMIVEELLSWVTTFTADEAPHLIFEGGRRGIETIIPTVQRLEELLGQFIRAIVSDPLLPDGLRHPRVRHPLQELRGYLRQVQTLAQDVRRP